MKAAPSKRLRKSAAAISGAQLPFEPLAHSVYIGRQRLGRYARTAPNSYAAYDSEDCPLGEFSQPQDACAAVTGSSVGASDERA
jgi:hypothetical protein